MKTVFLRSFALVALVGTLLLAACGSTSSSTTTTTDPTKFSKSELNLGLIPLDNATQEISDTTGFANALGIALGGVKVNLSVGTSYTATIEALVSGKIDAAVFGPLSYVLAHDKYNIQFLVRQLSTNGSEYYNSLIVTTPKTGITTVAQLKGHTFSFVDPASTSGFLIPSYVMTKAGINPKTDITPSFSGNHTASITAIVQGKVDAGAVASDTFAAQKAKGLFKDSDVVVIDKSFNIVQGPVAVNPSMSKNDQKLLKAAFLSIKAQNLLQQAGFGGFVEGSDSDYNGLRDVAKTLGLDLSSLVR